MKKDKYKTRAQLIKELEELRARVTKIEPGPKKARKVKTALGVEELPARELLETPLTSVILIDLSGKILAINSTGAKRLSTTKRKLVGKDIWAFFPEEVVSRRKKLLKDLVEYKKPIRFQDERIGIYFDTLLKPIMDKDGQVRKILIFAHDIAVYKKAEDTLKESETRFLTLFHRTKNPILLIDSEGNYIDTNQAALSFLECTHDELHAKNIIDFLPPGKEDEIVEQHTRLWADGGSAETEYYINGRSKILDLTITPVTFRGKKFIFGVGKDITERTKAEEALLLSRERFAAIVDKSPIPTAIGRSDGSIISFNKALVELIGYKSEEITDVRDWTNKLYPDSEYRDFVWKNIQLALRNEKQDCTEFTITCKDGSTKIVDFHTSFFTDGLTIQMVDITERIKAEMERKKLQQQLEQKNRELEEILYFFSHDLKAPMLAIKGFSNILDESQKKLDSYIKDKKISPSSMPDFSDVLKKDIYEPVDFITRVVQQMESIFAGFLKVANLGCVSLAIEKLDMDGIFNDIRKNFDFQIKEKNINLKIEKVPGCLGDRMQINQLFSNLLDNSIKFLDPARPGIITISGRKAGNMVVYCLQDNGIGIAKKNHGLILEIFRQLEPDGTEGQGLGLAIVKKIISRQGGKLRLESEAGQGCKFFISLPGI
ncbi:PAS domain S-box protein [Candidatus Riflebacteria bacterium]